MGAITVTGTVLEVEHKQGAFSNDNGQSVDYDFHVAHVLVGSRVTEVRFNPDNGDARPPAEGAEVSLEVQVPPKIRLIAKRYAAEGARVRTAAS